MFKTINTAATRKHWWGRYAVIAALIASHNGAMAQIVSTFAGGESSAALSTNLNPSRAVADGAGNVFVSDTQTCRIRKISPSGVLTTIAGTGLCGYDHEGDATSAKLNAPTGLALDNAGNLYIADSANHRVRRVTPAGTIATVAGTGAAGFSGDNGLAANASLDTPTGAAVSATGEIYIADYNNRRIRRVSSGGVISTFAGTGAIGVSGDGGLAINARLGAPISLSLRNNVLYMADSGYNRIRAITTGAGIINAFAGDGSAGFFGDGGDAIQASLRGPMGLAFDSSGNLFFADSGNQRVRRVTSSRVISTVAGTGTPAFLGDGGLGIYASLSTPVDVAAGPAGRIYIVDQANLRVRVLDSAGVITTVAGTGSPDLGVGDGGPATGGKLCDPVSLAMDAVGNSYIADACNNLVRKITPNGVISTIAGGGIDPLGDGGSAIQASLKHPLGVAVDRSGNVYVSEYFGHRIRKVTPTGVISTVAGTGTNGYSGDGGVATAALLNSPYGLTVDKVGNLYIADAGNYRIRKVSTDGVITTVAGIGIRGFTGDGGPATLANIDSPAGIRIDGDGNLWIAEGHRVRKVSTTGNISTVAGTGFPGYSGDGGQATEAMLNWPTGIGFDAVGNAYIADALNNVIRKVWRTGAISTVAGVGGAFGFSGDGDVAIHTKLGGPTDVAFDSSGNMYIADSGNDRIRKVNGVRRNDFNGDGKSDLLFQDSVTGQVDVSLMNGANATTNGNLIGPGSWSVTHTGDLNGDGKADVLWRNTDGRVAASLLNGTVTIGSVNFFDTGSTWVITHVADFDGDGKADILWRNTADGSVALWLMDGMHARSKSTLLGPGATYVPTHVADLNGDGKADIIWRNSNDGTVTSWLMNGTSLVEPGFVRGAGNWIVTHTADLNGDGKTDLLWRNTLDGTVEGWLMNGTAVTSAATLRTASMWVVSHVGDINGDGKDDILWRNTVDGTVDGWLMNGTTQSSAANLMPANAGWTMHKLGDYNGDGKTDLIWRHSDGRIVMWPMNGLTPASVSLIAGPGNLTVVP